MLALLPCTTSSGATTLPNACTLLSSQEVAAATHYRTLSTQARFQTGYGDTTEHGKRVRANFSTCEYNSGIWGVVYLNLTQISSERTAKKEFAGEIALASTNGYTRRKVSGPWSSGYQFSTDQVYALKGQVILDFQFVVNYDKPVRYREGLALGLTRVAAGRIH